MAKYRKKPVVIDAYQYREFDTESDWPGWFYEAIVEGVCLTYEGTLKIKTQDGFWEAHPGDWIIRGVKGELYPCKPDIFEATYEPVEDGETATQKVDTDRARVIASYVAWSNADGASMLRELADEVDLLRGVIAGQDELLRAAEKRIFGEKTWGSGAAEALADEIEELRATLEDPDEIDILFDGPPGHDSGRFVEAEVNGHSTGEGKWFQRGDYWVLRFKAVLVKEKP